MSKSIQTVNDFFESNISGLAPANKFVLVLDPDGFLCLDEQYDDLINGKKWDVIRYEGNDLEVRQKYARRNKDIPLILWITKNKENNVQTIDLSYIYDIVYKTECAMDFSFKKVLQSLIPNVVWPELLFGFAKEVGASLTKFKTIYSDLRRNLNDSITLNGNHIRAIIIALRNQDINISDLILDDISSMEALIKFITIITRYKINEIDKKLFEAIIENEFVNDLEKISPWLKLEKTDLTKFLYLLSFARKYIGANPVVQLRGIGLLSFDPENLDDLTIKFVLDNIELDPKLKQQINKVAETELDPNQIIKILKISNLVNSNSLSDLIQKETQALILYTLCISYIKEILGQRHSGSDPITWNGNFNNTSLDFEPASYYSERAKSVLRILKNLSLISKVLEAEYSAKKDLTDLINWWSKSGAYRVQITLAETINLVQNIHDDNLRRDLNFYLQQLKKHVHKTLEKADINLAVIIEKDWKGYLAHPRISTNFLHDFIIKRGIIPSKEKKIWILVFDGMRFDTWNLLIKPALAEHFEMKEEKLYFSMLPSKTDIARVALLAGSGPNTWEDYNGSYTNDHFILAPKTFGLNFNEGREKLKLTVACETDVSQRKLDETTGLYNILIYNLSDDWIHDFRGDILELNKIIEGTLSRNVIPDLERRIGPNDYVILTSDHGFIELDNEDEIKICEAPSYSSGNKKQIIAYRYLLNLRNQNGYQVNVSQEFFTVAEGRKWFSRFKGKPTRYAHGGISFDEMVVPGALLQKIVADRIELVLTSADIIELTEDQKSNLEFKIENIGNKSTVCELFFKINTLQEEIRTLSIQPKETQSVIISVEKPSLAMATLEIKLTPKTSNGESTKPQKRFIPIKVKAQKGKVEFRFGDLDKIMGDQ